MTYRGLAAAAAPLLLAACSAAETPGVAVTRLSPGQSLDCVGFLMRAEPVRLVARPADNGWRRDVLLLTVPPAGYVTKGALVHDGTVLAWLPDGAARGIDDERARQAVAPVLRACR